MITAALTVCLVLYFGQLLDPVEAGIAMDTIKAFHMLKDDSADVIVFGSSHAWKGCDTGVMRDKYGLSAYNYACNWQTVDTTRLFVEDALRTQSPKVVCIETWRVGNLKYDKAMDGQIYYTRQLKDSPVKRQYLKHCFGSDAERYASYFFPLIMFHDNWTEISEENFKKPDPEHFLKSAGYMYNEGSEPAERPDISQFEQKKLTVDQLSELEGIVKACERENVSIIFYLSPVAAEYGYSDEMEKFAGENGCVYLDLNALCDEVGIDWEHDLQDLGHLNHDGAAKVADYLGRYIVENYDI